MSNKEKKALALWGIFLVLGLYLILISSCAKPRLRKGRAWEGVYHIVKRGQTLWRIARTYSVDLYLVAEANGIDDPTYIKAGQALFIPGAPKVLEVEIYRPPVATTGLGFIWPLDGKVTSGFGIRDRRRHTGIDIAASPGEPIKAAYDGKVTYEGSKFKGYGNMIIIEHIEGFTTIYAHTQKNLVKKGEWVEQGQIIALVGSSGEASGPHLHFEIHQGDTPLNPINYLK